MATSRVFRPAINFMSILPCWLEQCHTGNRHKHDDASTTCLYSSASGKGVVQRWWPAAGNKGTGCDLLDAAQHVHSDRGNGSASPVRLPGTALDAVAGVEIPAGRTLVRDGLVDAGRLVVALDQDPASCQAAQTWVRDGARWRAGGQGAELARRDLPARDGPPGRRWADPGDLRLQRRPSADPGHRDGHGRAGRVGRP